MALKFVICGLEHSGTTLLSDIFRQVPGLDSGFEVGVLLCDSPRQFPRRQPFYKHMRPGWKISPEDLQRCCAVDTVGEFYAELHRRSGVLKEGTIDIFDKTPRYFWDIPRYYEKVRVLLLRLTGTLADLFSPTTPGALPVKSSGHGMPVIKRESCAILRLFMPAVICLR